jgi:hypothetical protein
MEEIRPGRVPFVAGEDGQAATRRGVLWLAHLWRGALGLPISGTEKSREALQSKRRLTIEVLSSTCVFWSWPSLGGALKPVGRGGVETAVTGECAKKRPHRVSGGAECGE